MAVTNDVARMFHRLVAVLASRGRLQEPIALSELYEKIIPYRTHRTSLRLDTNQDYEMTLLRLLAGEQDLIEVEPVEVAEALAAEARSINPDPSAFRKFSEARVRLSFRAVKGILEAQNLYAPPDATAVAQPSPTPASPQRALPFDLEVVAPAARDCPRCTRQLPSGRAITFCPHCGGNVSVRDCPECGTQLELDWRHCVTCGYRVT